MLHCSEVLVSVDDDRLLVRAEDPARLNAYLVSEGVRVDEIGPYRRTHERVISRRGGASMIAVRVDQDAGRPPTWLIMGMLIALPTLVAVLLAITDLGPRPGAGRRSSQQSSPMARSSRSPHSVSCYRSCCRLRWPFSAATPSPAKAKPAPFATFWSGPSGRALLLLAELVMLA